MARVLTALLILFAVSVLCFGIVGACYRPNTQIPPGFAGKHVLVEGVPLRVLQRGVGRDVLLLHGSPGSLEDWSPIVDALSPDYRLTVYDRPGHGYSGDAGQYSPEYNAHTALALIAVLGLQHVIVVGHSYGGAIALALALQAPQTVDGYVVVDSASYQRLNKADASYHLLALPGVRMGVASLFGPALAPKKIRQGLALQFHQHAPSEAFIALRTQIWSTPKVTHAIAMETLDANAALAAQSPRYPSIRAAVSVLAEADDATRSSAAQRLHRAIAGSSLQLVPNSGHYLQFEQTAAVANAIRQLSAQTM